MQIYNVPNKNGYFGEYGGSIVPPELQQVLNKLTHSYQKLKKSKGFEKDLKHYYKEYANRPSNLYFAQKLSKYVGGAKIYLKREDLNHTGAHKINNCIGQALVAKHMGKKKLIAETGAGQHGTATATVAAYFGMKCDIYMGTRDIEAQKPNVYRMKILGAQVIPVSQGQGTLKDAVDSALNSYIQEHETVHYLLGSAVGPHPYPVMVRDFQKIIGEEIKKQILEKEKKLPESIIACIGGGSNAIGAFYDFIKTPTVKLIGVEPAGKGKYSNRHGLSLAQGKKQILHGFESLVLTKENGSIAESYSVASGLDYPGVGPELSYLYSQGRLTLAHATDKEAINAFMLLSQTEGIIPALESAHAVAFGIEYAKKLSKSDIIVINLSGRGDKDVENICINYLKLV